MFRGVIFNRDKLVSDGLEPARRCLEVGSGPPSAVLVYDPRFLDHVSSPFHVERPDRLRSIVSHLERAGLFIDVERAPPATLANLKRVHRETYLEYFQNLGEGLLDPETAVHPGTFDLGLLAAGAVLHGTRSAVRDGRPTVALVRPPGHHAGPDYGGGFCYLNNVAVAAADQVAEGRRVAILDYDAHHGNGTPDIFADRASVLYLSTHEYGIYPGTGPAEDVGTGEGRGFTVNIPFSAGCGDTSYLAAHDRIVEPIVEQFRPDLILVSLGIDAHYRDPLTSLVLSSPGYVELLARSAALATRLCGSRFAVALEGGYHLDALGEVIAGVVAGLRGRSLSLGLSDVLDEQGRGGPAIEATIRAHRPFWNLRLLVVPLPLRDLALLLFDDPLVERVQELRQGDPEVPVELMRVIDPMGRREARPKRVLPAVALRLVLLEMDREGSRLHERRDPTHLLLDHGVDLVVRVLRLVLEPADLHEELLPFPQAGEELHEVLGRDDPHGLVSLRHDDRGDVLLGHQLRRALHVRVGPDRERRVPHDALHFDDDLLLAARAVPMLLAALRAGEQVDDVLQPDDALQVAVLVDDRHGAFAEGPNDLYRVFDRVVLRHGLRVRRHEVSHDDAFQSAGLDEGTDDVRAGDDSDERLPLDDGDRAEPGRDHLLRGLGERGLRTDSRRDFEDGGDFRGRL